MFDTRYRLIVVGCVLAGTLVSCEASDRWTPDDLMGIWISHDNPDGSALVVEMREFDSDHPRLSGVTPVYFIVEIPEGGEAEVTQYGQFDVRYESGNAHWVTIPYWSPDGSVIGNTYGNEIYGLGGGQWRIESSVNDDGVRTFQKIDAYPEE